MHQDAEEKFLELFAATGMDSRHGGVRTFYTRFDDVIILSDWRESGPILFLRNWIHELVHATGHSSRLARDLPDVFGSTAHGIEDLVAEIGTSMVCLSLGITPGLRHPDNIATWLALLRSDGEAFGKAFRLASAAADYLFTLRDGQAAAFDRTEKEEAAAECAEAVRAAAERRLRRRRERERWASGFVTGLGPRESLPAVRHGVSSWQNLHPNSS
jgi:antirestriction protein ArdC